jgi:hypothetical protein
MVSASRTSVTLTTWADPPFIPAGFATSDHAVEIENKRSSKIYYVSVLSASSLRITQFEEKTGAQVTRQCDIVDFHPVITNSGRQSNHYNLCSAPGSGGKIDQIETCIVFYDETQLHIGEDLYTVYDILLR